MVELVFLVSKIITDGDGSHEIKRHSFLGRKAVTNLEREVGGGIGMGNTCKPMAVSFQCMTKSTTIKK